MFVVTGIIFTPFQIQNLAFSPLNHRPVLVFRLLSFSFSVLLLLLLLLRILLYLFRIRVPRFFVFVSSSFR